MILLLRNWLIWIAWGLGALAIFLCLLALYNWIVTPSQVFHPVFKERVSFLPQNAFAQDQEDYEALSGPFLNLEFSPLTLQLPDLKRFIVYYGKNNRPDADQSRAMLHFSLTGSKQVASISPGEPLYLYYDKEQPTVKYVFSPENRQTSLWITAVPKDDEVEVKVFMRDEQGKIITEPQSNAAFSVKERPMSRFSTAQGWEIGKFRADSSLLSRQKARWYGKDLFLQRHGGEEFAQLANKERIDFESEENPYSVYAALDDSMIWKDEQWVRIEPGEDTREFPLLQVKQIDERLMRFDLWDVGGKAKISLNLLKSSRNWNPGIIEKEFVFVGAKTRSQFVFELGGDRITIAPKDWYLQTAQGWMKLSSPKEIDDYVDRKIQGILVVFDGVEKKDGRQVLQTTLFSPTRTQMDTLEIPIMQGGGAMRSVAEPQKGKVKEPMQNSKDRFEEQRKELQERFQELREQETLLEDD